MDINFQADFYSNYLILRKKFVEIKDNLNILYATINVC
jgi:hypothetical protein